MASNKTVATLIRTARDLMNHGGKHWIKGDEHGWVPESHKPGGTDIRWSPNEEYVEEAFCSIGAIQHASQKRGGRAATYALEKAYIEVARSLAPEAFKEFEKEVIEDAKERAKWDDEPFRLSDYAEQIHEELFEYASDKIPEVNDDPQTKWEDIRDAFTSAARRVSQRKS